MGFAWRVKFVQGAGLSRIQSKMIISSCRVALQFKSEKLQFDDNSTKIEITSESKSKKYFFDFLSKTEFQVDAVKELVDFEKCVKNG